MTDRPPLIGANEPISRLALSSRVLGVLMENDINTISHLCVLPRHALLRLDGFGHRALREVTEALAAMRLAVGTPHPFASVGAAGLGPFAYIKAVAENVGAIDQRDTEEDDQQRARSRTKEAPATPDARLAFAHHELLRLCPRWDAVLRCLHAGLSDTQTARALEVSAATVRQDKERLRAVGLLAEPPTSHPSSSRQP